MWKLAFVLGAAALVASTDEHYANFSQIIIALPESIARTLQVDQDVVKSDQIVIPENNSIAHQVDQVLVEFTTPKNITMALQVNQGTVNVSQSTTPGNNEMTRQVDGVTVKVSQSTTPEYIEMTRQVDGVVVELSQSTTPEYNETTRQGDGVPEESFEPSASKDNAMAWQIDQTIERVENRSVEVFEKVFNLGPQDLKAKVALTSPYNDKLGTHIQTLKSYVDGIILSRKVDNSLEKRCRKAFDDYAVSLVGSTLNKIENAFSEAFYDMSVKLGDFSSQVKNTKMNLIRLKAQTSTSHDDIGMDTTVTEIYNSFHSSTEDFLQYFMEMASGKSIVEKIRPIWNYNINTLGLEVIEKTYDCVYDF